MKITNADAQSLEGRINDAIKAGQQITWDWPNARLIVDTPTSKIYVGKTPGKDGWYRFSDGITVGRFDTDFAAFALVSTDGKPLTGADASIRMVVNARYDAVNTGFEMDMSILDKPSAGNPLEQAKYIKNSGHSPIIEQPVAFTVAFPHELQAQLVGYDAIQRQCSTQSIQGNELRYTGPTLFAGVLEIARRGTAVTTPQTTPMLQDNHAGQDTLVDGSNTQAQSHLWHPIPVLAWNDSYAMTHRLLRESTMVYTNMSSSSIHPRYIQLNEAKSLFDLPAEVRIYFDGNVMNQVSIKFTQPPSINQVLAQMNKRFDQAIQSTISSDAFSETRIVWAQQVDKEKLTIILTENQGVMQIIFDRK